MKLGTIKSPEGLWLVNKPVGISSFGVVARLRRFTGVKKVGHAGTLDPLASGLMLLLVGKEFTRQADSFLKLDKSYRLKICLGYESTTDDAEGEKTKISEDQPSLIDLKDVIAGLTGEISQTPPIYSAIKIDGQRAYKLARAGQPVILKPRPVTVYRWSNLKYDYPMIEAEVEVSSGTYIRSLAREIGDSLGCGGYLVELERTNIGQYSLSDALPLEKVSQT